MKLLNSTKKKIAAVGIAASVVASSGIAAAYWTSDGNGTGSGTVGDAAVWDVTSTPDPDAATTKALSPNGPTQTVTIHVQNDGSGVQRLQQLEISVAEANGDPWDDVSGCSAADFSVGSEAAGATHTISSIDEDIAAGATNSLHTVTIKMVDTGSNQDDCKNASVPLYIVAS